MFIMFLKRLKSSNFAMFTREREEYRTKRDIEILQAEDYCSIIVDGAHQYAFGLPQLATKTKNERGHALYIKLIGVIEHARPKFCTFMR